MRGPGFRTARAFARWIPGVVLKQDAIAGILVAALAIPLSMGMADTQE
jgi:MFS superfamily sulfate permease-like transporter